ncbi:MAG: hypothetical protein KJZ86_26700 [Caldilineaceae bacterium]|nr:hypothetical protein [Caldilineaceae bacterium]
MLSETVILRPDLRQTLTQRAAQEKKSVDELVNEAIDFFLQERQREKLDLEITAYTQMHLELWRTRPGQWVAFHNQELIDSDTEQAALYRRIREKYGRTAVLIRQVRREAVEELWVRTPSTGRIAL